MRMFILRKLRTLTSTLGMGFYSLARRLSLLEDQITVRLDEGADHE